MTPEDRASDQAAAAVPPGWVLVPVEPTPEMVYAALTADVDWIGRQGLYEGIYRAMLKAAPPAPMKPEVPSPYPTGLVIGPCVCGSWPGGECLRCPLNTTHGERP